MSTQEVTEVKQAVTKMLNDSPQGFQDTWVYLFEQLPMWKQEEIVDRPDSRFALEFAQKVTAVAEGREKV